MNFIKAIISKIKYLIAKCVKKSVKCTVWKIILQCFPRLAVKIFYNVLYGHFPNFKNPRNLNEKMQILKTGLYYNNPLVTDCIDKLQVKELLKNHFHVAEMGLEWAELYAGFDTVEDFFAYGFENYPSKFVIKCNHGSGYNYCCSDKNNIDTQELKKTLETWIKDDYWKHHAEYQYRFIRKKIFVEEFLENTEYSYKFYCFHGKPQFFYISSPDEKGNPDVYLDFFDMDFNHLPISLAHHKHSIKKLEKPECFEKLRQIAAALSSEFPFVRVDLYVGCGKISFSELTFIPTGGYMSLAPEETLEKWGSLLEL